MTPPCIMNRIFYGAGAPKAPLEGSCHANSVTEGCYTVNRTPFRAAFGGPPPLKGRLL